jgi:tetratricopeptide (TPR) repeat protein
MTDARVRAFPTVGIPLLLAQLDDDPRIGTAHALRAVEEAARLACLVEVARAIASGVAADRLKRLRLLSTAELIDLAKQLRNDATCAFPTLLPPAHGTWADEVKGFLDWKAAFVQRGELPDEALESREDMTALALCLGAPADVAYFLVREGRATRLHAFSGITDGLPFTGQGSELGDVVALHLPSGALLRLDPFYFEYGGATFGHYAALDRMVGLDPVTGYLFFSSRGLELAPAPLAFDGGAFDGLAGALYDERYELLGHVGDDALVHDRTDGTWRWLRAPSTERARRLTLALVQPETPHLVRFEALPAHRRYGRPLFVSEPLAVPSLEPLLSWRPDPSAAELSRLVLAALTAADAARTANVGMHGLTARALALGADGQWKWLPPAHPAGWREAEAVPSLLALLAELPRVAGLDALSSGAPTSLSSLRADGIAWCELASAEPATPEATLARLRALAFESAPTAPDFDAGLLLEALELGDREVALPLLDERIARFDLAPPASMYLAAKGALLLPHDRDAGLAATEQALDRCRNNLGALAVLSEAYEKLSDFAKAHEVLRDRLALVEGTHERARVLRTLVRLTGERLGRWAEALAFAEELARLTGDTVLNLRERLRLAKLAEDRPREAWLAEHELARLPADAIERRVELLRGLVAWHGQSPAGLDAAIGFAERLVHEVPGDLDALRALAKLIPADEASERAQAALKALVEQADFLNEREHVEALVRLGNVLRRRQAPREQAIAVLEDALARSPGDRRVLRELVCLARDNGQAAEAIEHLKRLLGHDLEPAERAALLLEIGVLHLERLHDVRGGLYHLQKALAIVPTDGPLFWRLVGAARAANDLDALREAHRLRAEAADDTTNGAQRVLEWLWLEESTGAEPARLFEIVEGGLARWPARRMLWVELERLVRAHGQTQRFVQRVEADVPARIHDFGQELVLKAAIFAEAQLNDPARAVLLLAELLDRDQIGRPGLVRLLRLFARSGQLEQARGVLEHLERTVPDDVERRALYVALGSDLEADPDTVGIAVEYFERVLAGDPRHEVAWRHLKNIHEALEDWNALLDTLERESEAFPERRPELRLAIGTLLETRLGHVKDALEIFLDEVRAGRAGQESLQHLLDRKMSGEEWKNIASALHESLRAAPRWELRRHYLESLAYIYETILDDRDAAIDVLVEWYGFDPHNEALLTRIVGLLLAADRWNDVLHFYRQFLSMAVEPAERIAVLEKMADIYELSLSNPLSAIALLNQAAEQADGADQVRLLSRVRDLCLANELWEPAIANLDDQIRLGTLPQIELLLGERATLLHDKLGDFEGAAAAWNAALQANPGYLPALEGLTALRRTQGRWRDVLDLIERQIPLVATDATRVHLYVEGAAIARDRTADVERATRLYQAALSWLPTGTAARDIDLPTRGEIVAPLLDLLVRLRRWADADQLGTHVLEHLADLGDPVGRVGLLQRLGRVAEELRKDDVAIVYYEKALAIDPEAVEVQMGLGFALTRLGRAEEAHALFKKLLEHEIERLPRIAVQAVNRQLQDLTLKVRSVEGRVALLERAAAEQANDPEILRELVGALEGEEQWEKAIAYAKTLIEKTPFDEERLALRLRVADWYATKLQRLDPAIEAYRAIVDADPSQADATIRLLQIHLEAQRFQDAIRLLERFVEADRDDRRRAQSMYSLGVLVRDHTPEARKALEWFDKSLDLDPERLEAFSAIEEIAARLNDPEAQVEAYQRMIQRIKGAKKTALEYRLFLNLGKIFLNTLGAPEKAGTAFEKASALRPDEVEPLELLVELTSDDERRAVIHERLLAILPTRKESLKFLRGYFTRRKQYDRVWNLCSVIRLLGLADEKEDQFHRAYVQKAIRLKKVRLEGDVVEKLLYRPEAADLLPTGRLLGLVDRFLGDSLQKRDPAALGYPLSGPLNPDAHRNVVALAGLLTEVLGVDRIAFAASTGDFFCKKERLDLPTLVLGRRVLDEPNLKKVAFLLGKYLASFREENVAWRVYPVKDLRALLLGALVAFFPGVAVPDDERAQVEGIARLVAQAPDEARKAELQGVVKSFVGRGETIDIKAWVRATELNLNRFGLAVANDVEVALAAMKEEGFYAEGLTAEVAVTDLLFYQEAASFSRLKDVLGTAIRVEG